jgi:hypothetical protein
LKKKYILLISIVLFIISASLIFNGCNEVEDNDNNNINPVFDFVIEPGYDNCLVCHTGGLNPINQHCSIIDPVSNRLIDDSSYSPSLDDCTICHINIHNYDGDSPVINVRCHICHQG